MIVCIECGLPTNENHPPDVTGVILCSSCVQAKLDAPEYRRFPPKKPYLPVRFPRGVNPGDGGLVWVDKKLTYFVGWEETDEGVNVILANGALKLVQKSDIKRTPKVNIRPLPQEEPTRDILPPELQRGLDRNIIVGLQSIATGKAPPKDQTCVLCGGTYPNPCESCRKDLAGLSREEIKREYQEAKEAGDLPQARIFKNLLSKGRKGKQHELQSRETGPKELPDRGDFTGSFRHEKGTVSLFEVSKTISRH